MRRDSYRRLFAFLFSLTLGASAFAGGIEADEGWWVVLGSFPNPDLSAVQEKKIESVKRLAARCGFDPFNDFSNKFRGFTPGYDVVVIGAFGSQTKAQSVLRAVKRCVPAAYLKLGRHLGE